MLRSTFALVNRLFPHEEASAHCDVPCGIYDPHYAQIAALTVVRMNQLIEAMEPPPAPTVLISIWAARFGSPPMLPSRASA